MKKVILSAALVLAVAGSWAFYPKAAEPTGYMMVIGNFTLNGFTADANVTTILPDGQQTEVAVEVKVRNAEKVTVGFVEVQKAALAKVNALAKEGWQVVNSSPATFAATGTTRVNQTVYLLARR